ncbi:hypothetical protein E2C01_095002 [Portunus trituberculatus]|uniref:Uncharacterized protein n=1 Tax=Portunus trituberculatus TaxID=210409 RepID=A0A5B7JXN6_PORTR|nr:hypothetical protein [Portunus trituberculatus]
MKLHGVCWVPTAFLAQHRTSERPSGRPVRVWCPVSPSSRPIL